MTSSPLVSAPGAPLVDTHAHLMDPAFHGEVSRVLQAASEAGVGPIVCPGYDLATSEGGLALARQYPHLRAAIGIHPNRAAELDSTARQTLAWLASEPEVVAIGEMGLDFYRDRTSPEQQLSALDWQLHLAEDLHLPVIIHNRDADGDLAPALEASAARRTGGEVPGVLHCFSSCDPTYLGRMLNCGYLVSFAGPLTFKNAGCLTEQALRVPDDRLLVETDSPYLAPVPFRGRRNEPAFIAHTARRLAELRGVTPEQLADQMWSNVCRLFPALRNLSPVGAPP